MIKLPKKVFLRAVNKHWKISYIKSPGKLVIVELPHRQIVVYGKNYSKRTALNLITKWIRLKAHAYLTTLLHKLNRKVKVKFKKLIIRSHEAQWGSYSSTKTMSLNYKLIFLPQALAKHVILHELCHVHHLSHAKIFWDDLARYDKHWEKHRTELFDADKYIPEWVIF